MNKYIFIFLPLIISLGACKKSFLDPGDKSAVLRQEYVVDLKTTGDYLNGVYVTLSGGTFINDIQIYGDLVADNTKPATSKSYLGPQYNWSQTIVTGNMNSAWQTGYLIARECSFVIDKATVYKDQDPQKSDDYLGQAYALRAYAHFLLVNLFAQPYNYSTDGSHLGIPYVTTSDWTQGVSRQSVADVYNNLILDLNNSISLLPDNPTNVASASKSLVINKNAAKALLARIYLFKNDFASAKGLAREVSDLVPIMQSSATEYPSKLFTLQEKEALFQLSPASTAVNSGTYFTSFPGSQYIGSASQVQFLATTDIASLLTQNANDVRKSWIKSGGAGKDSIVKYPLNVVAGFPAPGSQSYYPTLLRSSEMYLTAAESYAKLNNEDSARFYLNAIRTRAKLLAVPVTVSGSALLDSIYLERRKEFAFEGLRLFDLLRLKKDVNRVDAPAAIQKLLFPSNKAISPIPALDVDVAGLPQNLDY